MRIHQISYDISRYLFLSVVSIFLLFFSPLAHTYEIISNSFPKNGANDAPILIKDFYAEFTELLDIESIKNSSVVFVDKTDGISIKIPISPFLEQIDKDSFLRKMVNINLEEQKPKLVSKISITINPRYCLLLHGHKYEIIFEGALKNEKKEILNKEPIKIDFKTIDALTIDSIEIPENINLKNKFDIKIKIKNNIDWERVNEEAGKGREILDNKIEINDINISDGFKIEDFNFKPKEIKVEKVGDTYDITASCENKKSSDNRIYNVSGVVYASFERFWSNKEYSYTEVIKLPFNQVEANIETKVEEKSRTDINVGEILLLKMELENKDNIKIDDIKPSLNINPEVGYEVKKISGENSGKKWIVTWNIKPNSPGDLKFIAILKGYANGKLLLQSEGHCSVKVWYPSDLKVTNIKAPEKVSVGQAVNVEVSIKNGDSKETVDAKDIKVSAYIKNDKTEYQFYEKQIEKLSALQTEELKFVYVPDKNHIGQNKIYINIEYKDCVSGNQKSPKSDEYSITIETAPDIIVNLESFERKIIGIDKEFFVTFKAENKGETTVRITPQINDLNIINAQSLNISTDKFSRELVSEKEVKLAKSSSNIIYRIATKKDETSSGIYEIKLISLLMTNENDGSTVKLNLSVSTNIVVDMEKPELINAIYKDKNKNGILDFGDIIELTFNEDIDASKCKTLDNIIINPETEDQFGKGAIIKEEDSNKRVLNIVLGEKPNIKPTSKYNIKVTNVFDLAGNTISDKFMEIQIFNIDKYPPKILGTYPNEKNNIVPSRPVVWLRVKDDSSTDTPSGVNRVSLRIYKNKEKLSEYEYKYEYNKNESKNTIDLKIVLKDLTDPGTYNLIIEIEDNNGNETQKTIEFTIEEKIDIMTFPNPVALNVSSIYIKYEQKTNEDKLNINIYDTAGCLVRSFAIDNPRSMDFIEWDGKTDAGEQISAGVYLCELVVGSYRKYWNIAVYPNMKK